MRSPMAATRSDEVSETAGDSRVAPAPRKRQKRATEVLARERIRAAAEASDNAASGGESESPPPTRRASRGSSNETDDGAVTEDTTTPKPIKRREVVPWTPAEEKCLLDGVRKYGIGRWVDILDAGRKVFLKRRTNVDLKDKWKNLVIRCNEDCDDEVSNAVRGMLPTLSRRVRAVRQRRTDRKTAQSRENNQDTSEPEVEGDDADGDDSNLSDYAEAEATTDVEPPVDKNQTLLLVGTNTSFPHLVSLAVSKRQCGTVLALKQELTRRLLGDVRRPTNLQLVAIKSRRLLGDLESVDDCVQHDGNELFLLYDT